MDAVVLPGGFSYGDYLRCGAIARFAPVMDELIDAARGGLPVLGICNGFQVLCESHLLPGALVRNDHLHFVCRDQQLRVENAATAWTGDYAQAEEIIVLLKNGEGGYVADERTLDELEAEGRVVARYLGRTPTARAATSPASATRRGNVVGPDAAPEHASKRATARVWTGCPSSPRSSSGWWTHEPARDLQVDTVERAGQTPDTRQPWAELGLKTDEYDRIREILGRRPTSAELAMYSVMWSEHCSYKSSQGAPAPVR